MGTIIDFIIKWKQGPIFGNLSIERGRVISVNDEARAEISVEGDGKRNIECRITCDADNLEYGPFPTVIRVSTQFNSFSFFARDIHAYHPIFIREYGVAVTSCDDIRNYNKIAEDLDSTARLSVLEQIENSPEASFAEASKDTVVMKSPSWLGAGRDYRVFLFTFRESFEPWHRIAPKYQAASVSIPESGDPLNYYFMFGRGVGSSYNLVKRLESGVLPILHGWQSDGGIDYHITAFTTIVDSKGERAVLSGSHYLTADGNSLGFQFTDEQQAKFNLIMEQERTRDDVGLFCLRIEMTNSSTARRYAFCKVPVPYKNIHTAETCFFNPENGTAAFSDGSVCGKYLIHNKPLKTAEAVILLDPQETVSIDCFLPHSPLTEASALLLDNVCFRDQLQHVRTYWLSRLNSVARISLPEQRIEEMMKAGFLQLDISSYGLEPNDPCAAVVGALYTPIGSESAPIIQYFDSIGEHALAERCINYFLEKQREDGQMLNFFGYTIETGAVLWTIGEHFRYTGNRTWIGKYKDHIVKACRFIIDWRSRNKQVDGTDNGYGLLDGKVADDEDSYHIFKNSGYAYLGLKRIAEVFKNLDPEFSIFLTAESDAFKKDILTALGKNMISSPILPLSDGSWSLSAAPWTETTGPTFLQTNGGAWYSHYQFSCRDALHGPCILIFNEVLDPYDFLAENLLRVQSEFYTTGNTAFSQPYHSRHDYIHLLREEVKPFLEYFYRALSSLADRETYEFWEHFSQASPHKTHEQAWFLMQCRWMLYLEVGNILRLLSGIPRLWLSPGNKIQLQDMKSYFGSIYLNVSSAASGDEIIAEIELKDIRRLPDSIEFRLPHPKNLRATAVTGGLYDRDREKVIIKPFTGKAVVSLCFQQ